MTKELNTWTTIQFSDLSELTPGTLIRVCFLETQWQMDESDEDEEYPEESEVWTGSILPGEICVFASYNEESDNEWEMKMTGVESGQVETWSSDEPGIKEQHWGIEYDPNDMETWPLDCPFFQIAE
jgi:hypothetical protein